MRVTVALSTWNRAALLRQTLEQMTRVAIPPGLEWELVVVDNNSADQTADVLKSFASALPLRALFEPRPGASHARNRALEAATGEYILWTDDDVLVDPGWIEGYCAAFGRWPDASVFGGPIEPYFLERPPRWLLEALPHLHGVYAIRDFGNDPLPLTQDRTPFGANLAFRRSAQLSKPYDPTLGPTPERAFGGEETAVVRALLARGATGWWVPKARVRHCIPASRQTLGYIRRYFVGYGETAARNLRPVAGRSLLGRPWWLWHELLNAEGRYLLTRVTRPASVWMRWWIQSSVRWGTFRALAGVRK